MHGNLEPEDKVLGQYNPWFRNIDKYIQELGWDDKDDIRVFIGGCQTSGINTEGTEANPRWSAPYNVTRHNDDAFIVIQNHSRRDLNGSQPLSDQALSDGFVEDGVGTLFTKRKLETVHQDSPMADSRSHPWIKIIRWVRSTLSN